MSPRHLPNLRRSVAKRLPKRKFWLFCEGKNTEPVYFNSIKFICREALIEIESAGGVGDPSVIAETAIRKLHELGLTERKRRKLESYEIRDEVWAVFDRDVHERFDEAVSNCRDNHVNVARSNPCFEVWLILHFQEFDRPDDRHQAQKFLETLASGYDKDKGKVVDCSLLVDRIEDAENRAERQLKNREREGNPFGPPSTTVYELTRSIKAAAKMSKFRG